jgi:signal peptidase I
VIPALAAVGIVRWCEGSPDSLGEIGNWVRDQNLPAGIVLFTLVEMTLYYFRHHLPLAAHSNLGGRAGLPPDMRRDYEAASHLLEEASRIIERRGKAIERELPRETRDKLKRTLETLQASLVGEPFDAQGFRSARERANLQVDQYLAPWRKSEAREYLESIGVAILIALALRAVVVEAFKIPSGSMLPTLQIDDHIFVNKFVYGPTVPFTRTRLFANLPPERGDVMVFEFPDTAPGEEAQDFIKRVIAIEGDTLEVDNGHPIINGWQVPSCPVGKYPYSDRDGPSSEFGDLFVEFLGDESYLTVYEESGFSGRQGPYKVKKGEAWVLGDNRHNSHDSRAWFNREGGGVPYALIQGRAMSVWFPWNRILTPVMGHPQIPKSKPAALTAAIEKCLQQRPAVTEPPGPLPSPARR